MAFHRILSIGITCGNLWLVVVAMADEHTDLPPSHSVKPELYATGFEFAEGPTFDDTGNLFVVNYRGNGRIGRIAPDGTALVYCDLRQATPAPAEGRQAQANGLKVDRRGRLIVADAGGGRILRIESRPEKPPAVEVLADAFDGRPLSLPNDVALDLAGNIYFTDSGRRDTEEPTGAVYRYDVGARQLSCLDTDLAFANGLAVAPDQRHLCVAESRLYRVLIYDLAQDGRVSNRRILIDFPEQTEGDIVGGPLQPDGMVFDAAGRLYVAMFTASGGVVNVVEVPTGKLVRQYDSGGAMSTNVHFFDRRLYTTVAGKEAVFRLKLGVEGFNYRRVP